MNSNEKLTDVLNDLIRINNDRVAGYEKAADEVSNYDADLVAMFKNMADDSREYAAELSKQVRMLGEEPVEGTTGSGKIYRIWMDVKATFAGKDRQSILSSCEYGEDAAQDAYQSALESDAAMNPEIRQMITGQKENLKMAHDIVKKYRDLHDVIQ